MWNDILTRINVVDVVMLCIIVRIVYIGLAQGLIVELFKVIGMIVATFITIHYYVKFALFIRDAFPLAKPIREFLSFGFLWFLIVSVFAIVRSGWIIGFKVDRISVLSRIAGGFLALGRAALVCGLVFIFIFLSGNRAYEKSARQSLAAFYLLNVSTGLYDFMGDGVVKVFPAEKKNGQVFELVNKGKKINGQPTP
jgi:uncharacterized membrane protein required for colicin V production